MLTNLPEQKSNIKFFGIVFVYSYFIKITFINLKFILMKKEWIKPSIVDFANSKINTGTEEAGSPEAVTRCVNGSPITLMNAGATGKSSTTFETCS